MRFPRLTLAILLLLIQGAPGILAQGPQPQSDMTIDGQTRSTVVDSLIKYLNEGYVFPDTAKKMEAALRAHQQTKDYDNVTSAVAFAKTLTTDLQSVSHDKHLRVQYSARPIPPERENHEPSPEQEAEAREFYRTSNCGFEKAERLPGNIGYLDMRQFASADLCGETAIAAMNFLGNSDALIIDLRRNGGGDPAMVSLVASFLFDQSVHLNDLYFRPEDSTHQWWTQPPASGKRLGKDKPVYVLTSNRTFSAAEEFTYDLQNLKRSTTVGEITGGGANPGGGRRLSEHFGVFVPSGRAINPVTKTNWEGTGVKPEVQVPADKALKTAQLAALRSVVEKVKDPDRKRLVQLEIDKMEKEIADHQ